MHKRFLTTKNNLEWKKGHNRQLGYNRVQKRMTNHTV